jgi:hypothetical protein
LRRRRCPRQSREADRSVFDPIHRGLDLFREWLADRGLEPASDEVLQATYAQRDVSAAMRLGVGQALAEFATQVDEVVAVGDDAMLVAGLRVG